MGGGLATVSGSWVDRVEALLALLRARIAGGSIGPLPIVNHDFYIASTGNDANAGTSPTAAVRSYARLEQLFPGLRTGALRVHFLDAGPFPIVDGVHLLPPAASALTPPVQFLGTYAEDPLGGAAGTQIAVATGPDSIQGPGFGLTPNYYGGAVLRRQSGDPWTRYFVTSNDTSTYVIAFPGFNGPYAINDDFDVVFATSALTFGNVVIDLNGGVLVCDGMVFLGSLNAQWLFTNGVAYIPGCRVNPDNGRFVVEQGGVRTFDETASAVTVPQRYPAQVPDFLGFHMATGDLVPGVESDVTATVSNATAVPSGADIVNDQGGTIFSVDSNLIVVNEGIVQNTSRAQMTTSTHAGGFAGRSRMGSTGGPPALADAEGLIKITNTVLTSAASSCAVIQKNGTLTLFGCTGHSSLGFGVEVANGGDLEDDGNSLITGSQGELLLNGQTLTWKQFHALGSSLSALGRGNNPPAWMVETLLWLRADFVTLNAGNVATLFDLSTNATNLVQANPLWQPLWEAAGFGGKPSIAFDGVTTSLAGVITALAPLVSGAAVGKTTVIIAGEFTANPAAGARVYALVPSAQASDNAGSGQLLFVPAALGAYTVPTGLEADIVRPANGTPFIHAAEIDGAFVSASLNGTLASRTADTDGMTFSQLWLGAGKTGGAAANWAPFRFAEIVVIKAAITDPEFTAVHRYMGNRYGIAVA
jgi:hypothetical protein